MSLVPKTSPQFLTSVLRNLHHYGVGIHEKTNIVLNMSETSAD